MGDPRGTAVVADTLGEQRRREIVEEMGVFWEQNGSPRMQGRIVGYLMLSDAPSVSTAELMSALQASAGSISTSTRLLVEQGFIRRVAAPAERSHYFRAEEDVWGAFLAGERGYLHSRKRFAEEVVRELGDADTPSRRRMSNMRDYMAWLADHHRAMLQDWEDFKRDRDAGNA